MKIKLILFSLLLFCGHAIAQGVSLNPDQYFESIKNDPIQLMAFLTQMPKGGDLHNHLGGAVYAEDLLTFSVQQPFEIDAQSLAVKPAHSAATDIPLVNMINDEDLRNSLIDAWSTRHCDTQGGRCHDHFFATFFKFYPLYLANRDKAFQSVVSRAGMENEIYLELMETFDEDRFADVYSSKAWTNDFTKQRQLLLSDPRFQAAIQFISNESSDYLKNLMNNLQCATQQAQPGCQVTVRFLYQVMRNQPINQFFAQVLAGFEAAKINPSIVGVNIVQQEDGYYSIKNYDLEMQIIAFLHTLYPMVHYSLHAGELAPGLVAPQDLTFHIDHAVNIAHADRIGHGVDIVYEKNARDVLTEMVKKHILVEINLTSNATILGIQGKAHPLPLYLKYHVPVALSTDDEGVLRTDLVHEFYRAEMTYHFPYSVLKSFVRNSLAYSFLPGENLWRDLDQYTPVEVCQHDKLGNDNPSPSCKQFLSTSQKAQLQWKLEKQLGEFEASLGAAH